MREVRETRLPGVGVRHEFETEAGRVVGVVTYRDGRREVLVYDDADPDVCASVVELTPEDTRTMTELLGASQVTEAVTAVQQHIEGLTIEWIQVAPSSGAVGRTIGAGGYRSRTGASIIAVIHGDDTVPAPGPEYAFTSGDVAVAVGTVEGLRQLRSLLSS